MIFHAGRSVYRLHNYLQGIKYSTRAIHSQDDSKFTFLADLLKMDRAELAKIIKISNYEAISTEDIEENALHLMQFGVDSSLIRSHIPVIAQSKSSLRNKLQICEECGCFKNQTVLSIIDFKSFVRRNVSHLKRMEYLPNYSNLIQQIWAHTGCEDEYPEILDDNITSLKNVYEKVYEYYLVRKEPDLMKKCSFNFITKGYPLVSIRAYKKNVEFIKNSFKDSVLRTKHRTFFFSPVLSEKLELGQILKFGEELLKNPTLLNIPTQDILRVHNVCMIYGLDFSLFTKYSPIFSVDASEFESRVRHFLNFEKLKLFKNHVSVAKLIKHYDTVLSRLEILEKFGMTCYSLKLLMEQEYNFWKHVQVKPDMITSNDTFHALSRELMKPSNEIKRELTKNSDWNCISISRIMQNVEFLKNLGYNSEYIFKSIQILLYPKDAIEKLLNKVILKEINIEENLKAVLKKEFYLPLTLYYLEKTEGSVFSRSTDIDSIFEIDSSDVDLLKQCAVNAKIQD